MRVLRRHARNELSCNADLSSSSIPSNSDSCSLSEDFSEFKERPLSIFFWVVLSSLFLLLSLFAVSINFTCQSECPLLSTCNPPNFTIVEANARNHLREVTRYGQRDAGSFSNEVKTPLYLIEELRKISILAKTNGLDAFIDEHISKYSSFKAHLHISTYANVRNIVFRIHNPRSVPVSLSKAVLINCHFDAALSSPGASDDFVSCAIMLEVARVLASGSFSVLNDVIFLFNGAEESLLLSSHAFITQHQWAKDISVFVNLEGAGVGGRMVLFQVGPGMATQFLLEAYSKSFAQPFGTTLGEEVFQSGILPADTDYRIFSCYGLIPGIDMAYVLDGYAYHSKYDAEERIPRDCLQQSGNNVLNFLVTLLNDSRLNSLPHIHLRIPEESQNYNEVSAEGGVISFTEITIDSTAKNSRLIYFDILGRIFITCGLKVWRSLEFGVLSLFIVWVLVGRLKDTPASRFSGLFIAFLFHIIWLVGGVLFLLFIGWVTHQYGCRMSWYATRFNIIFIYVFPAIWFSFCLYTYLLRVPDSALFYFGLLRKMLDNSGWIKQDKSETTDLDFVRIERDHFDAGIAVVFIGMFVMICASTTISYIFFLVASVSWASKVICHFCLPAYKNPSLLVICLTILPFFGLQQIYQFGSLFEILIPIFGRTGQAIYPDIIISALAFLAVSPLGLLLGGYMQATSPKTAKWLRFVLLNACLSCAVLVHASPYGFPYAPQHRVPVDDTSQPVPRHQRVVLVHVNRVFRDVPDSNLPTMQDSGVILLPLDVNGIRYLTPNSYPSPAASSLAGLFQSGPLFSHSNLTQCGLAELVGAKRMPCVYHRPFCGLPLFLPFAHAFTDVYYIPKPAQNATPRARLKVLARDPVSVEYLPPVVRAEYEAAASGRLRRRAFNITLAVVSGPPHTHIMLRTAAPHVRLLAWSFAPESGRPRPLSLPPQSADSEDKPDQDTGERGAHYFIYHANAGASGYPQQTGDATTGNAKAPSPDPLWATPHLLWLLVDVELLPQAPRPPVSSKSQQSVAMSEPSWDRIEVALVSTYADHDLDSSKSPVLDDVLARLPPWTSPLPVTASYEHWSVLLA